MSDSWKNHGGTRTNTVVSTSIADNTKNIYKTDSTLSKEDTEGIYYYKEGGPSTFGVGTKRPHSRLSFGDYLVNNIDADGNVKAESLVNNEQEFRYLIDSNELLKERFSGLEYVFEPKKIIAIDLIS